VSLGLTARPMLGFWMGGCFPAEQLPRGKSGWCPGRRVGPSDMRPAGSRENYHQFYMGYLDAKGDFYYVGSAPWDIPQPDKLPSAPCRVAPPPTPSLPMTWTPWHFLVVAISGWMNREQQEVIE
jgi:hypothetical protein